LSVVVARALGLFRPGELRALRVGNIDVFRLVLSISHARCVDGAPTSPLARSLDSLCAVELASSDGSDDDQHAAAVIERCAATVTELIGPLPGRLLCESDSSGRPPVLARCTRLEILTDASRYITVVWLGLSQLHTLTGVDFGKVSVAAIAAALPRLRTLKAYRSGDADTESASVAGFFTDLLPRLRVFHFEGSVWPSPTAKERRNSATPPQLEELVWSEAYSSDRTALSRFLGARPVRLRVPCDFIIEGMSTHVWVYGYDSVSSMLARVCELHLGKGFPWSHFGMSDVARVLRAAPQLRALYMHERVRIDTLWLTQSAASLHPSFVGLVHPQLRHFAVNSKVSELLDDGCASRLRQACFPALRVLEVRGETFFVTPLDAI
jgi:hypothetical protein